MDEILRAVASVIPLAVIMVLSTAITLSIFYLPHLLFGRSGGRRRFIVQFNGKMSAIIRRLARKKSVNEGEMLIRMVALYKYVTDELKAHPNRDLSIADLNGNILKIIEVP
jgi:hypothetical protein